MADFTISGLTEKTAIDSTDEFIIDTGGGVYRRVSASNLDIKKGTSPIILSMMATLDTTNIALFKIVNGFTYTWYGKDLKITAIRAVQATADTGATQGTVNVLIGGTTAQASAVSLSGTDDTYVSATLTATTANLEITSGDTIDVSFVKGTNEDATNLSVFIYVEDNQ